MAKQASALWSDPELAYAVDAYVFLLQAERAGLGVSESTSTRILLSDHLNNRNEASIRYRMRNISAVAKELDGPVLKAYSPAEQVGGNVRAKIRAILTSHPEFQNLLTKSLGAAGGPVNGALAAPQSAAEVIERLQSLRAYLADIERQILGVGHNQPPEPLSASGLTRQDFEQARASIDALERQVTEAPKDEAVAKVHTNRLLSFGLKVATWVGARVTKFTDVALTVLAPVVVAKLTGLAPVIISAVSAATHFFKP